MTSGSEEEDPCQEILTIHIQPLPDEAVTLCIVVLDEGWLLVDEPSGVDEF